MKGLDPKLLSAIVERAHRQHLRVSVHITTAADFRYAVLGGVDEIVHSGVPSPFNTLDPAMLTQKLLANQPALGNLFLDALSGTGGIASLYRPVAIEDAKLAARRGITVVTTILAVTRAPDARRSVVRPAGPRHAGDRERRPATVPTPDSPAALRQPIVTLPVRNVVKERAGMHGRLPLTPHR
jgi:hypothetical protein